MKFSGFPIPEKAINFFLKLNLLEFFILYFVLKTSILGLICFINLMILLFFLLICFKKLHRTF